MTQPETGQLLRLEGVISLIGMKHSWILQKVMEIPQENLRRCPYRLWIVLHSGL